MTTMFMTVILVGLVMLVAGFALMAIAHVLMPDTDDADA